MYIIAGLGNPTKQYEHTRHNVGFDGIDLLGKIHQIPLNQNFKKAIVGKGIIEGQKVLLVKPQTYMNLSGESLGEIMSYYKEDPSTQLIVLYDDISLDPGSLRIRQKGSAGGHNGIKSMIQCLGTDSFLRIKIGVGNKPDRMDLADYVLGHFTRVERESVESSLDKACKAVEYIVRGEVSTAMNLFNKKKSEKE